MTKKVKLDRMRFTDEEWALIQQVCFVPHPSERNAWHVLAPVRRRITNVMSRSGVKWYALRAFPGPQMETAPRNVMLELFWCLLANQDREINVAVVCYALPYANTQCLQVMESDGLLAVNTVGDPLWAEDLCTIQLTLLGFTLAVSCNFM